MLKFLIWCILFVMCWPLACPSSGLPSSRGCALPVPGRFSESGAVLREGEPWARSVLQRAVLSLLNRHADSVGAIAPKRRTRHISNRLLTEGFRILPEEPNETAENPALVRFGLLANQTTVTTFVTTFSVSVPTATRRRCRGSASNIRICRFGPRLQIQPGRNARSDSRRIPRT